MNLVYKSDKKPKTISVKNMIMTGLYNDQANMTLIRVDDFEEGIKLTPEQTEQTFNLK
jgi:translation elongation factor P/translation initiation factor 5A